MSDWSALTTRTIAGIESCDPVYRPTTFWSPGVKRLLTDLERCGLDEFKSWPSASTWFYPTYGNGLDEPSIERAYEVAREGDPELPHGWFETALSGAYQARRDFDAARLAWDHDRWPFDLDRFGESEIGHPPQFFRLSERDRSVGWTRPYLNYLLCLAALSREVDEPPRSFLEIGGGYGVLGEIVLSRDPSARYVNLDLPPMITVSSYYLQSLFGHRVTVYDATVPDTGPIPGTGSASLPNWRIEDVAGPFDVFVNSFSFQEMEPAVVEQYVKVVAAKGVTWVVSLNSREGKPRAGEGLAIGVDVPVTSTHIVDAFARHDYDIVARHGEPLIQSAAELVILRRSEGGARPISATPSTSSADVLTVDHRLHGAARPPAPKPPPPPPSNAAARLARAWLPPRLLRAFRRVRRRLRPARPG
jgi:putative sugar O-methyltransferase